VKKHDVRHCWCLGFSPWTFHPVFHGVKTTQHLGKIPGVPCNVCTVQFPGTATSRPALPGAGPMCLRCLAEFWITGKIREVLWNYFGIATEIPRCSKWFLVITTWEAISFGNYLESLGITMELVCFIPIYPPKKTKTNPNISQLWDYYTTHVRCFRGWIMAVGLPHHYQCISTYFNYFLVVGIQTYMYICG
jgi:hypothetical protein